MIQATELRIGNYLTYHTPDDTDMPCKIDAQDILNISTNYMHNAEIHSPIPLTEEILLKSGARRIDKYTFVLNGLFIHMRKMGFVFNVGKKKIVIEHLHKLQNLTHALTNTELNITL